MLLSNDWGVLYREETGLAKAFAITNTLFFEVFFVLKPVFQSPGLRGEVRNVVRVDGRKKPGAKVVIFCERSAVFCPTFAKLCEKRVVSSMVFVGSKQKQ
jgi:hypothetical protein